MIDPDMSNIHTQIRMYVQYTPVFVPIQSAAQDQAGSRSGPCAAPPRRCSAGSGFQDPQMAWSTTFGRKILTLRLSFWLNQANLGWTWSPGSGTRAASPRWSSAGSGSQTGPKPMGGGPGRVYPPKGWENGPRVDFGQKNKK